ncbi:hypothetical protein NIES2135_62400 (plasmid) [Leptolyngbya boryana NIES-2135]|jgi:uncharacterized protein YvpB|uniref:Peptidase C39-like domain-containing protein n=1 Tax=Leptolyngbya boryana NIES-2135 TaxID=1973484 RepID=A0A1Z4JRR9_LEPBY|nr:MULTISPECIES: C39 family peptidase [Leptolyngbya]BAY59363.1 hypothetical protein NIES2135_62400 [Leptolyngbya boryana NIES-2135]MBD2372951.1 C39 family peptidase [Leptolyngbya sp. FACHB-238]MBD2397296.1 C39 family peptidase [Leptolyngbya sp. FACHB-239]MBD2403899.1 C39 family peptidase [Leptolyngbya sp. FACHB-402]ULP33195.1 C39 family peptidase [Leptolyngbya boryana IU 594]
MKLKILQNTILKQSTASSSQLPDTKKVSVPAGQTFELHSWKPVDPKHLKIAILEQAIGNPASNEWYVFVEHAQLIDNQGTLIPIQIETPKPQPERVKLPTRKTLNVLYKSQIDNELNPMGACNVTCYAMAMVYWQRKGQSDSFVQLEDELYQYMEDHNLSRHEPLDLIKLGEAYRLKVDYTSRGSLYDIRKAIAEGKPCIVHGYFTSFGHIIVIRGYDETGFWVNDPYGEWTESGYRNDLSGENLHYSNELIQSKCSPEGEDFIWLHRISKA